MVPLLKKKMNHHLQREKWVRNMSVNVLHTLGQDIEKVMCERISTRMTSEKQRGLSRNVNVPVVRIG